MMKQYLSKATEFLNTPVSRAGALGTAAIALAVAKRDYLMELATKKKTENNPKEVTTALKENVDVKVEKNEQSNTESKEKSETTTLKENAVQ
ncbi:hypothetical protein CARUB_v10018862mg [Capsella rubella]|uniref:Uncharacterized protein n=1 Tax=Capsella rubella TaxID=81985 RepID=R0HNP2_9BRAS|nr:uncharacterized protein LOC17886752 [Capsella rubella]EOA25518.1 hypothetical protein CARUB_v10018862mg [Capsella rubella]